MSTNVVSMLVVVGLLFALLYFFRKSSSRKTATLGHHLLASGSIIQKIYRN